MNWWRRVGVAFYEGFVQDYQKVAWTRKVTEGGSHLILHAVILSVCDHRADFWLTFSCLRRRPSCPLFVYRHPFPLPRGLEKVAICEAGTFSPAFSCNSNAKGRIGRHICLTTEFKSATLLNLSTTRVLWCESPRLSMLRLSLLKNSLL